MFNLIDAKDGDVALERYSQYLKIRKGDLAAAQTAYEQAHRLDPHHRNALANLGATQRLITGLFQAPPGTVFCGPPAVGS